MNEKLIQLRGEKKLTQEQMAALLGVDRSTYAHYERGRKPHLGTAIKIAQIFGVPVEYIFSQSNVHKLHNCVVTGTDGQ